MPLSPLFSNVILRDFDRRSEARGLHLVRYADDFVVFADSESQCLEIDAFAREELGKLNLRIPEITAKTKTQVASPTEEIEFLGLGLYRVPGGPFVLRVTPKQIKEIKNTLNESKDLNRLVQKSIHIGALIESLTSRIKGYSYSYDAATNIHAVRNVLNDKFRDVLESLLSQIFGPSALGSISSSHRAFLKLRDNVLS